MTLLPSLQPVAEPKSPGGLLMISEPGPAIVWCGVRTAQTTLPPNTAEVITCAVLPVSGVGRGRRGLCSSDKAGCSFLASLFPLWCVFGRSDAQRLDRKTYGVPCGATLYSTDATRRIQVATRLVRLAEELAEHVRHKRELPEGILEGS